MWTGPIRETADMPRLVTLLEEYVLKADRLLCQEELRARQVSASDIEMTGRLWRTPSMRHDALEALPVALQIVNDASTNKWRAEQTSHTSAVRRPNVTERA